MRRHAPILFAILSALFLLERAISGGAFAAHAPQIVGLHDIVPLGAGADCLPRGDVLAALAQTGARLQPEPVPFCTDRPDLTDWVAAAEVAGTRHLAFDGAGCLAIWAEAACP